MASPKSSRFGAEQLTADAVTCVRIGVDAVRLHPRDPEGRETLNERIVDALVRRVRSAAGVAVSTGTWIELDPERRRPSARTMR
jgi:uncharacterized protein (DUF849 family)